MIIENPYAGKVMENVSLKVTGLLSRYISVYPETVAEIKENESANFIITIEAPSYFTKGEHDLEFLIKSKLKDLASGSIQDLTEERNFLAEERTI